LFLIALGAYSFIDNLGIIQDFSVDWNQASNFIKDGRHHPTLNKNLLTSNFNLDECRKNYL